MLTILGLTIGVAAFIAMVAFSDGARKAVMAQFETLGTHAVFVRSRFGSTGATGKPAAILSQDDVAKLRREVSGLQFVAPSIKRSLDVRTETVVSRMLVMAVSADFFRLRTWPAAQGGVILDADEAARAPICVLGASTATRLYTDHGLEPLGARIRLGRSLRCSVVGVLTSKGSSAGGSDQDEIVFIPIRTYIASFGFADGFNSIDLKLAPEASIAQVQAEVTRAMRRSHRLGPKDSDDFALSSPDDVIKVAEQTSLLLGRLLAGVALVSLLVGGIGIMNILLVSVGERTQEIGIRSAIGAPPKLIMAQFLAEAVVLSTIGALLGAGLGGGMSLAVAQKMGWAQSVGVGLILMGIGFGVVVGLVFGLLPARRAATLDPILALRKE